MGENSEEETGTENKENKVNTGAGSANTNTEGEGNKEVNKPAVDEEKIKKGAVSDYLKSLGVEEGQLSEILKKHKEEEEANKTELQKEQDKTAQLIKELAEERELRKTAELKLSAIQMGANKETVDDLILIAGARVTDKKDINTVLAEMKEGTTGAVYFAQPEEEGNKNKHKTKTTVTRTEPKKKTKEEEDPHAGTFASRHFANKNKTTKSNFFGVR